jgi:hypothetical protein
VGFDSALSFDDCLLKPVASSELLMRVDALAAKLALDGQGDKESPRARAAGSARRSQGGTGHGDIDG